jgi:transmembrane sensor
MSNVEKYKNYSEEDFINDPFFQDSVLKNDADVERFWSEFINECPHKRSAIEGAHTFLKNLSFKQDEPEEQLVQQALSKHLIAIKDLEKTKVVSLGRIVSIRRVLRIAAVVGGVILIASALFIFKAKEKFVVKTDFGKIQSVVLPDNSLVVLNANSKIEYRKRWKAGSKREVWLDGEAFFEVKHLNKNPQQVKAEEQFVLHTKDAAIEVLGTSFDVRERRGKTEVVLQTGSIKVTFNNAKHETIFMKPGDMIAYNEERQEYIKSTTVPENYAAWKERKLLLNNPTVNEIVEYLEDNYGKKIILQQAEQGKIKIEGPIMLSSLDDALFILSTVLNSHVSEKNDTIIIRPR